MTEQILMLCGLHVGIVSYMVISIWSRIMAIPRVSHHGEESILCVSTCLHDEMQLGKLMD